MADKTVRCVFAATNSEGVPDFGFVIVACDQEEYDEGLHYDAAKAWAGENDYEGPFVVFDENDGPDFLFEHFVWESASTITPKDLIQSDGV
jgi:hypothetical protein